MGVYIPGMEMPKGCYNCQLKMDCYECEGLNCFCLPLFRQIGDGMGNVELPKDKREDDCPLVPVPPHGRLGDLDKLHDNMLSLTAGLEYRGEVMHEVRRAPTIIPAEEAQP